MRIWLMKMMQHWCWEAKGANTRTPELISRAWAPICTGKPLPQPSLSVLHFPLGHLAPLVSLPYVLQASSVLMLDMLACIG